MLTVVIMCHKVKCRYGECRDAKMVYFGELYLMVQKSKFISLKACPGHNVIKNTTAVTYECL
jgi:hypothetical protein